MTEETVQQEVTAGVTEVEAVATEVVDHAQQFTTVVQTELQNANNALQNLQTHSAASTAGNLVSDAIASFKNVIQQIEQALGIYKTNTTSTTTTTGTTATTTAAPAPEAPAS